MSARTGSSTPSSRATPSGERAGAESDPAFGRDGDARFWMLLTALSGVQDENECARLVASALPAAVSCELGGLALRDDDGEWRIELHHESGTVGSTPSGLGADRLERLLEAPSGRSGSELEATAGLPVERLRAYPLRTLRGRYGLLLAGGPGEADFGERQQYRLERVAEQLALVVENLRLTSSLRSRSRELEDLVQRRTGELRRSRSRLRTLLRINNALVTHRDRADLFRSLAAHLRSELGLDRASIALHDPDRDTATVWALEAAKDSDTGGVLTTGKTFPVEDSGMEELLWEGEADRARDLRAEDGLGETRRELREAGIRSYVSVPLRSRGEVLGSLHVGSREPDQYDADDAEFLRNVADQVALAVENVLAFERMEDTSERLRQENRYLRKEALEQPASEEMVGESPELEAVRRKVQQVSGTGATVLVTGESGTGKELVAHRIHRLSDRSDRPLVKVNCASIPRDLYESEFFGHAEGAFTGAVQEREGRFAAADGGTLFLDEIAEIPLDLQAKLLRVLQEEEYERVGEERTRTVDVRIVAATNRDLRDAVREGRFRKDLFFRLNVFPIEVPPLRERKEDIAPLARHFLRQVADELGRPVPTLRDRELEELRAYDWPGNVRELRNVIERAVITASPDAPLEITLADGDGEDRASDAAPPLPGGDEVLTEAEMERLRRRNTKAALERADGQIYGEDGAAELLGIPPTTLASRMKKMGLRET